MIGNRVLSIRHHIIKVRRRLNLRCNGVAKDGGAVHLELSKACIESTSSGSLQSLNLAWIKVGFPLPSGQLDQLRTCAFRPMVAVERAGSRLRPHLKQHLISHLRERSGHLTDPNRWRIAAARCVVSSFAGPPALLSLEIFQEIRSMLKDTAGLSSHCWHLESCRQQYILATRRSARHLGHRDSA